MFTTINSWLIRLSNRACSSVPKRLRTSLTYCPSELIILNKSRVNRYTSRSTWLRAITAVLAKVLHPQLPIQLISVLRLSPPLISFVIAEPENTEQVSLEPVEQTEYYISLQITLKSCKKLKSFVVGYASSEGYRGVVSGRYRVTHSPSFVISRFALFSDVAVKGELVCGDPADSSSVKFSRLITIGPKGTPIMRSCREWMHFWSNYWDNGIIGIIILQCWINSGLSYRL